MCQLLLYTITGAQDHYQLLRILECKMNKKYSDRPVRAIYCFIAAGLLFSPPLFADFTRGMHAYTHYDYQTAWEQFTLAGLNGHSDAQYFLGEIYEGGVSVPLDYKQAFHWYLQAAKQSHARAQARLGGLYASGRGAGQDWVKSFNWYLRSAENGYPLAQFEVGLLYTEGKGTAANNVEAYKWLTVAASYGDPEALTVRQALAVGMSPADIDKAARLARTWESRWESRKSAEE
jgi:TPR repeat protein